MPSSNLSEIFGTNNLIMCQRCKGFNNQPKESEELCATDAMESLQSWALSCHKSDSPKALYIFMQPSTFILSIHTSLCSLYISTHIISLYLYVLFICYLYVPFIIYLLHLYSIHICMFSTFYAPLYIYVSLHLM